MKSTALQSNPLRLPWLISSFVVMLFSISVALAHFYGAEWQQPLAEEARIFWRTIFYVLALLTLPITNLLRHIFLHLNQTMPPLEMTNLERVVQTRYALTVSVSMLAMLFIGCLGATIFYLGDGFNTLHILTSVAALGVFLYRPKLNEYQQIQDALTLLIENEND